MHRIHSIEVSETTDGEHAIMIKLGGELDNEMEPILRLEFDKTLCRERSGGVILDLRGVNKIEGTVIARISSFSGNLDKDCISLIVVPPRDLDVATRLLRIASRFEAMVPTVRAAKEMLGIH
jgi:anti-anti-sigma regulatory factor